MGLELTASTMFSVQTLAHDHDAWCPRVALSPAWRDRATFLNITTTYQRCAGPSRAQSEPGLQMKNHRPETEPGPARRSKLIGLDRPRTGRAWKYLGLDRPVHVKLRALAWTGLDRPSKLYRPPGPRLRSLEAWTDRGPMHIPRAVSVGPNFGRSKPVSPKLARPGTSLANGSSSLARQALVIVN